MVLLTLSFLNFAHLPEVGVRKNMAAMLVRIIIIYKYYNTDAFQMTMDMLAMINHDTN